MFEFVPTRRTLLLASFAATAILASALEQMIASASTSHLLPRLLVQMPFGVHWLVCPPIPRAEHLKQFIGNLGYTLDEVGYFNRYVKAHPEDTNAREWLGYLRYHVGWKNRNTQLLEAAERDFTTAIRSERGNADVLFHRAIVRYDLGDKRGALGDCTEALRIGFRPFNCFNGAVYTACWVHQARSLIREELGDWRGALEDSDRALELENRDANRSSGLHWGLYWRRGRCFALVGDWASAAADFEKVVSYFEVSRQVFPGAEEGYLDLGYALAALGRWDQAARAFRKVVQFLDGNPWISVDVLATMPTRSGDKPYCSRVSLGYAHAALGERDEAIENFRKAIEMFEKHSYVGERDKMLANLEEFINRRVT
ncbi:tetratricopeptide repeat protein [Gloeobacter morelensis]|uniref:Tetratricopeptide repeat protein n=1 Tax=Gloeobacter morelensis MG652769 TaxID=2781736 RepID=A0ABY3PK39_9CYAN|nr:tetratricopeptide repeat protein [Gloeobacter morelensis]UFP93989.1 tetratricopeptide repeat protein [Gloeobacter morelensis MG652769]